MLSRVQELEQLFILGSVPEDKLYPSGLALAEVERLSGIAINKQSSWYNASDGIKIACLNIQSLQAHYNDLEKDFALQQSDVYQKPGMKTENTIYLDMKEISPMLEEERVLQFFIKVLG